MFAFKKILFNTLQSVIFSILPNSSRLLTLLFLYIYCMRISRYFLRLISVWTFLLFTSTAIAQQVGLKLDFFGYIDNREYKSTYTLDRTILGTMISPTFYFALDSSNRVVAGLHYNQDFGTNTDNKQWVKPIVYYQFKNAKFDFALGHMPRYERLKDVPKLVLADTFMYDRPNIEGLYLAYKNKNFRQSMYIDWLSKQSPIQRERFVVGTSGKYKLGAAYFANDALLYHNALTSTINEDEHVQDNGIVLLRLGADLSKHTLLDSLTIDAGFALGFDRIRSKYEMRKTKGFLAQLYLAYKSFSLANSFYQGDPQNLPLGDSFYQRKQYDRLDLGWTPFRRKNLEAKFIASFHFAPDATSNQQSFSLRYTFNKKLWR